MRIKLATPFLPAVLIAVLAACGGAAPGATTGPGGATQRPGATQGGGNGGNVDCDAVRSAAQKLVGIQLLAQLTTPQAIETIKSVGNLDLDALLGALDELHALDTVSTPLGNAKESIETYEKATRAAKELFAMAPVTQAAIDAFNSEHVGTVGEFLAKQAAISGAIGEAGC
ncbi:MAG TPA: hypothetical protein VNL94_08645 [Candidatus Binatia bacterium]|nr:hypothetical protein [Candidatus Binatia bacterium]